MSHTGNSGMKTVCISGYRDVKYNNFF